MLEIWRTKEKDNKSASFIHASQKVTLIYSTALMAEDHLVKKTNPKLMLYFVVRSNNNVAEKFCVVKV